MADKITNKIPNLWSAEQLQLKPDGTNSVADAKTETSEIDFPLLNTKLYESNANAVLLRERLTTRFIQNNPPINGNSADLETRADNLGQIFESGVIKTTYQNIAPHIEGLSQADAKKLQIIYQQKTGRNLLSDIANHLFLEDRIRAFESIAPERIHRQILPDAKNANGEGIVMNPPTDSVMWETEVNYDLRLNSIGDERKIKYLLQDTETGNYIEKEGGTFSTVFPEPQSSTDGEKSKTYRVVFEVRYGNQPPEFYTYRQLVQEPKEKALGELLKLSGTAPDSELFLAYMDGQIERTKNLIGELETTRQNLLADIRNNVGNSSDKYDQLRKVEKQITELKNILPELEVARANTGNALSGSVGKPIPLQAVLVARENGQSIPLQLYAKNLGGGKWAIVDVTNPAKPRIWEGEGILPADALRQAWQKFVNGSNDLPAGQIAAIAPKNLGFQEGKIWNDASRGQSTLKQWSNGLGIGSLILGGLGLAATFGPGTQGAAVPLLLASGILGGGSAGLNVADRLDNGTFKWNSGETALDLLGIVGGIASLGGVASLTNAGRTIFANGAKYTVQRIGNATRISQGIEYGTNAAGGILISNEYVSALDNVNRSSLSSEQKAAETNKILAQAVATGGLIIFGIGLARKFTPPNPTELNQLLKTAALRPELEQLVRNDLAVQKIFVNHGKDELSRIYDDYLAGLRTGKLKVKSFGQYLGTRGYRTSLEKDTTTLSETIGSQNLELMSPRQINERILELTNPGLYRAAQTGQLPANVRQAVDDVLNINQNLSANISFRDAQAKLNKQLYSAIGGNLRNTDELNRMLRMFGDNPSARGSIGNAYYQKNLAQGERINEFGFNPELWTGTTGTNRRADDLLIRGRRTLDIKTGYADGNIEIEQLKDYNNLVKASQSRKNVKLRKYLEQQGVKGGVLDSHDYLFMPNGITKAEDAARNAFRKIEGKLLPKDRKNVRVFYLGEDGNVYQIMKQSETSVVSKFIGSKLPN